MGPGHSPPPEDEKVLIETLWSLGEIIGVAGDGTYDSPTPKTTNTRLSTGITGVETGGNRARSLCQ